MVYTGEVAEYGSAMLFNHPVTFQTASVSVPHLGFADIVSAVPGSSIKVYAVCLSATVAGTVAQWYSDGNPLSGVYNLNSAPIASASEFGMLQTIQGQALKLLVSGAGSVVNGWIRYYVRQG